MNETTKHIHKTVYRVAIESNGKHQWMTYRHDIRRRLEQLQPDICDDGSVNRLAFNVGIDKPRMKIKTGRFLTKKLQLNSGYLDDVAIQKIASTINFHLFGSDIETKLLNGFDITEAYENEVGTSSCMTGSCANYTRLYENNPTRFQMLTMFYGNNSARAIVHKLDNGEYLLDRVYSDCEELKTRMRDYARGHNWHYRINNSVYYNGSTIDDYDNMIVSGLCYDDGEVPYMDTLTEYRIHDGEMDIFHRCSSYNQDSTLNSQNGEIEDCHHCEACGESMCEDDMMCVNDVILCRDCYSESYSYCESCGEDYHNDDSAYIEDKNICVCIKCADNSYYYCEDCNTYNSEIHQTAYEQYVCESCLENYGCCEGCNEYFTSNDITDGYCENCQPEDEDIPEQNENDAGKLPFEESIRNAIIE